MPHVTSADGTPIAYEHTGSGPVVVLVDGANCHRAFHGGRPLAELLANRYTVFIYDRRGRGESGDTPPFAVEREIEDLAAVIDAAGGSASVYGTSSGGALLLRAAAAGLPIDRIALYETPFAPDATAHAVQHAALGRIDDQLAAGQRGAAMTTFLRVVGMPAPAVAVMRLLPMWRSMKAVAPTLHYDLTALGAAADAPVWDTFDWASVQVPALVMAGTKSQEAALVGPSRRVAELLPDARFVMLDGQTHMVSPRALAPHLAEFLGAGRIAAG